MSSKTVVTSGITFTDIDTLACAIAYGEVLNQTSRPAEVYLPGPLNQSIIPEIKSWNLGYQTQTDIKNLPLVVVDVSEPNYLKNCLDISQIIEIYDHHYGHEKFWQEKLGIHSHIETVGACATLIWEQTVKNQIHLSKVSTHLLYTAIFSNTLNFNSSVTHDRDRQAFSEISGQINLPDNWITTYYQQLEFGSISDPVSAIKNDIKIVKSPLFSQPIFIGQLELWQNKDFIQKNKDVIKSTLTEKGSPYWFFTSPSISEGKNYLYTENSEIKDFLTHNFAAQFTQDLGITPKLYLRKEILKKLQ